MATHGWRTGHTLVENLEQDSSRFNFYQVVRLLEQTHAVKTDSVMTVLNKTVLFRADIREDFPRSAISSIEFDAAQSRATLWLARFGLAGRLGPLPQPYSIWIQDNISRGDWAMADFLDIFNHRLAILLYLARKKYRLALHGQDLENSPLARYTDCLFGFGTANLKQRLPVEHRQLQAFSGLLANTRISLPVLKNCLSVLLGTNVEIKQFKGDWMWLESNQCTHLGSNGTHQHLGTEAMLGSRVWDQHAQISVTLGPLSLTRFLAFLPGSGSLFDKLLQLVEFLAKKRFNTRIVLGILQKEIPAAHLSSKIPIYLGRTSWLKYRETKADARAVDQQVSFVLKMA